LIVTSGGKNISPQNIENALITSRFIEQVAVIGDNRKYLAALIVPSYIALEAWAKENNLTFTDRKDLISKPEVQKIFEAELVENMKDYARVEQIKKFTLLETEWTQDTGEMTPTMKVKRKVINQKYGPAIEAMYPPE
jgi:long-chain acyl-CoA synthetase